MYTRDNGIVGYIFRHDSSGGNDGIFTDGNARQYYCTRTDPRVAADDYWLDQQPMPQSRFFRMVFRQNFRSRSDE